MKFLIAGLGSIGRRHLRNLVRLGERDIILYRTHRATLPDDDLAGYPVETDLRAALDLRPDAVIVANPTALHLDVAIPAARAGCHLFLEKPISHDLNRLDELEATLRSSGRQALTGFQFRFHPGLQQAQRLLMGGAVGKPISARAHWGEYLANWHPWEDYRQSYSARGDLGGGVVRTLCHPLDYLRWLLGEISALWAFTGRLGPLELEVEDTAEIGLRFGAGQIGSLHLDYNQRPPAHWLEIIGAEGTLRWDNATGAAQVWPAGGEMQVYPAPDGFERNDMFLAEMAHFISVMRGEAEPLCTLQDGAKAVELALAVLRSSQEGVLVKT
jgi:predicted dehydrogenase